MRRFNIPLLVILLLTTLLVLLSETTSNKDNSSLSLVIASSPSSTSTTSASTLATTPDISSPTVSSSSPSSSSPPGGDHSPAPSPSSTTNPPRPKKEINVGFNFASEEAGAKILSSNREAKKVSRILNEDSDKYCLIPRTAQKKWIVVELSEEILMKSIAIANYEYYSCSFKHFKVFGSVKYPCKEKSNCWELVGTFQAANNRKVQHFTFKKPTITKYVKLEFLTHYGEGEYYCTLSLVRVHGSTLLEDLKKSLQKSSKKNSENVEQISNNGNEEIKKEEAHLNELIKENTEQIVSIYNSDKDSSKRVDQLEQRFGKLLNDDITNLINEQISNRNSNAKIDFWILQIKKKFQSYSYCDVKEKVISFTIDQPTVTINCNCKKHLKKEFMSRVVYLNYTGRDFSNYNRSSATYSNTIHNNTILQNNSATILNTGNGILNNSIPRVDSTIVNLHASVCNYSVHHFVWKCPYDPIKSKLDSNPIKKTPSVKETKKKSKSSSNTGSEDDTYHLEENPPIRSTLSNLLNEKQNILKSLFNASKYYFLNG